MPNIYQRVLRNIMYFGKKGLDFSVHGTEFPLR
jgi:hypothetical protein